MSNSGAVPVVVDCDPGIDDAVALALVAASPEFDLRAVTTVRGNVPVDLCTRNAARLLAAFGRPDVAVAGGATRPLVRANLEYPRIHGSDGLGEVELPAVAGEAGTGPALTLLERVLEAAAPGEVTVVALGPLTNLALLLDLRPDLAERIGLLAVMGATIDRGNVTPFAEFNVWVDPEAAHRVLVEGELERVRLFTLAATRRAALNEDQRLELASWSPAGATLAQMILGYDDQVTGAGWPLHDAIVVAALLDPSLVTLRPATAITVDTSTTPRRGHTSFEWDGDPRPNGPTLEVAVNANPEAFRALLSSRISTL